MVGTASQRGSSLARVHVQRDFKTDKTRSSLPPTAASPSNKKTSQSWDTESPDPFALNQVVTWQRIANDTELSLKTQAAQAREQYTAYYGQSTNLVDNDFSQRVPINPVTFEEMLVLARPASPKRGTTLKQEREIHEECSPTKAYMMRNGGFPGSSHLVGDNALLLMSSLY